MKFPPFTLPFIFSCYESAAAQDFSLKRKELGCGNYGTVGENASGREHYVGAVKLQ